MATISLTIPDAQLSRVVDALCLAGHWSAETGLTKNQFAKAEAARMVRERVLEVERRVVLANAVTSAAALAEPQVD